MEGQLAEGELNSILKQNNINPDLNSVRKSKFIHLLKIDNNLCLDYLTN